MEYELPLRFWSFHFTNLPGVNFHDRIPRYESEFSRNSFITEQIIEIYSNFSGCNDSARFISSLWEAHRIHWNDSREEDTLLVSCLLQEKVKYKLTMGVGRESIFLPLVSPAKLQITELSTSFLLFQKECCFSVTGSLDLNKWLWDLNIPAFTPER